MLDATEEACDLDLGCAGTGNDGDVADTAAPDPTAARDWRAHPRLDWFRGHLRLQPAADR
jgi:hypothetical protein